jgi:phytoene synthase
VHEPLPGEIRLQWWRDLVEGQGAGDAMANPLAAGILYAIAEHNLPRTALAAMTEARVFDLYDDPMESARMFEGYAGETASALIQMTMLIVDPAAAPRLAEAAGHAGIAQFAAGAILLLPIHRRRGQIYVPGDILSATGLDGARFLAGEETAAIEAVLSAFVGFGRDHLRKARAAAGSAMTPEAACAFLPAALAEAVFDRADKAGIACFTQSIQPVQWRRMWRLWRAHRRASF